MTAMTSNIFSPVGMFGVIQSLTPSVVVTIHSFCSEEIAPILLPPPAPHTTLPIASNPVTICPLGHVCPPCTSGATFPVLGVAPLGIGPGFQFELAAYTSPTHTAVVNPIPPIHLTTLCHRGSLATEWGGLLACVGTYMYGEIISTPPVYHTPSFKIKSKKTRYIKITSLPPPLLHLSSPAPPLTRGGIQFFMQGLRPYTPQKLI